MFSKLYIKKNKLRTQKFLIFLGSFLIIFISFSKERQFRYEYQKGAPWQHEDLFASYGFSIYKLPEELKYEIDSINNNLLLYFSYSENYENIVIEQIEEDFEKQWANFMKDDSLRRKIDKTYKYAPYPNKNNYKKYLSVIIKDIKTVYNAGIYDPSEILNYTDVKDFKLVFMNGNFIRTYTRDNVFTLKLAYEFILDDIKTNAEKDNNKDDILNFYKKFTFEKYINPNLKFDKLKTKEIKELSIENISKTRGFMQAGELIVGKGEIISLDKFRILESYKNSYEQAGNKGVTRMTQAGNAIVVMLLLIVLLFYLKNNQHEIYDNIRSLLLIFILIIIFVGLTAIIAKFSLFNIYIFPVALLPLILKTFFDDKSALFILLVAILLLGFIVPNGFEFVVIQFIAGFASIFGHSQLTKRSQLYYSAFSVFVAMSLIYTGIAIIHEGSILEIDYVQYLYFGLNGLLLLSAYPLIYAFERLFGFISDITLLELSSTNNTLLQKISTTAPGTFQHSLQVSHLAEAAAKKIGANSLLVRVGALYHDIGKTSTPAFFIENQVTGYNPHDQISFDQSAQIIINHVTNGIAMATKNKLPQQLIDFIRTHHGTTTVQYFYKNYIKKFPDKKDEVEKFTYPGPKPFSKETAILMMSDAIEAASRSLKEINVDIMKHLVENIIDNQMQNKQFDDANITLKEITTLKELYTELLLNIYHARIEYPK